MKPINIALASLLFVATTGAVQAQNSPYISPDECASSSMAMDINSDGYVSGEEIEGRGRIETNVDTNGDGWISVNEITVACYSRTADALTPSK